MKLGSPLILWKMSFQKRSVPLVCVTGESVILVSIKDFRPKQVSQGLDREVWWDDQKYSYNKTNEMHQFLKFIFGLELYMFRTVSLSIIRSLVLYTQQQVYVIQVMLTACERDQDGISWSRYQEISITCMTYTYCCVYSSRLLMMDREAVRNM